jgi:acetyl-CoA C-acetyltransferase
MRDVAVIGSVVTKFGKHDKTVVQLLAEASMTALRDSNTVDEKFGMVLVGNMSSGEFEGRSGIANALVGDLALEPAFATKLENTSGSGGAAFYAGWLSVASGQSDLTLVAGGEKMSSVSTERATEVIASLTHEEEFKQGVTLLSFAGLTARLYMDRYGATREAIAKVAVKNHETVASTQTLSFRRR